MHFEESSGQTFRDLNDLTRAAWVDSRKLLAGDGRIHLDRCQSTPSIPPMGEFTPFIVCSYHILQSP